MKTNRREFIKISTAGLAASALTPVMVKEVLAGKPEKNNEKLKRTPTYCEVCFWNCAGWVYSDGKSQIYKIEGNLEDPHCNGRLCPRGTGGVGMYNDEDRLKKPLIRRFTKSGKAYFEEVDWDEALDYTAQKLQEIKSKYGSESVVLLNHGKGAAFFRHLMKAFGAGAIAAPSYAQCRGPREVGFKATFGSSVGSPEPTDIRNTDCLVLIGSHIGENMHNGQIQEMSEAIDRGATIITVDPRFSTAASKSKYWLPIRPATDIALLLAWIHVIIYDELYDKEFVEKYTTGFEELKAYVKDKTPEWAYGYTTIEPALIRKTAHEMHHAAPRVIIHPGRHVTWYGDDAQRSRAIAILNALLGSWGKRGGFYKSEKVKIPAYPYPPYPRIQHNWRNAIPGKYKLADSTLSQVVVESTIPDKNRDWRYHAWVVYGTNLIKTLPDKPTTLKAIENLDFMVVVDTMPMEITGYADVVLPECTYLERYDLIRSSGHREPNIALRMPAVPPKYDSKPGWWIARELGLRMGLKKYFPWKDIEELLDWQLKKIGTSLEEMKKVGVKKFPRKHDDLYFLENNPDYQFKTPSGKIELYSTLFEKAGYAPLPPFTEHPQPPAKYYRLIYGRAPMHTFSRTANNPNLTDLMSENNIWINPAVAKIWNLKNGQEIWLKNQDGVISTFPAKVRITERIRFDSVYIVHGFGHNHPQLSRAHGKGVSDSEMITRIMTDEVMGGTGMRGNFVTFLTKNPYRRA